MSAAASCHLLGIVVRLVKGILHRMPSDMKHGLTVWKRVRPDLEEDRRDDSYDCEDDDGDVQPG